MKSEEELVMRTVNGMLEMFKTISFARFNKCSSEEYLKFSNNLLINLVGNFLLDITEGKPYMVLENSVELFTKNLLIFFEQVRLARTNKDLQS